MTCVDNNVKIRRKLVKVTIKGKNEDTPIYITNNERGSLGAL